MSSNNLDHLNQPELKPYLSNLNKLILENNNLTTSCIDRLLAIFPETQAVEIYLQNNPKIDLNDILSKDKLTNGLGRRKFILGNSYFDINSDEMVVHETLNDLIEQEQMEIVDIIKHCVLVFENDAIHWYLYHDSKTYKINNASLEDFNEEQLKLLSEKGIDLKKMVGGVGATSAVGVGAFIVVKAVGLTALASTGIGAVIAALVATAVFGIGYLKNRLDKAKEKARIQALNSDKHKAKVNDLKVENDNIRAKANIKFKVKRQTVSNRLLRTRDGQEFIHHKILGDGNCGYNAYEIERKDAHDLLLEKIDKISVLLQPGIEGVLIKEEFIQFLINDKEVENSDQIDTAFKKFLQLDKEKQPTDAAEAALLDFSNNKAVIKAYLRYDILDKKIDNGYMDILVMKAIAQCQNTNLYVWTLAEDSKTPIPHPEHHSFVANNDKDAAEKHVLFVNNNHFDRLVKNQTKPSKSTASTFTPKPKDKASNGWTSEQELEGRDINSDDDDLSDSSQGNTPQHQDGNFILG